MIGITRTMDYRHHSQDVGIGMLLGISIAYFSYRQYYPSLAHPFSHRPFASRYDPVRKPKISEDLIDLDGNTPGASQTAKGKGPDLEAARAELDNDSEDEIDYEMEGTLPRSKPSSLSKLWTAGTRRLHMPLAMATDS